MADGAGIHDCQHRGHIWLTPEDRPYVGHLLKKRDSQRDGLIEVHCKHCPSKATLPHFKSEALAAVQAHYPTSASRMTHRH